MDPAAGCLPAETLRFAYDINGNLSAIRGSSAVLSGTSFTPIGQVSSYSLSGAYSENPLEMENVRGELGLPNGNSGEMLSRGQLICGGFCQVGILKLRP
ncbi:hypothetical protein [Rathayibacter soli]|uniref:hypothetical protein n=1 Tax=Rathayibacter soli TaxID=3144168 RepID=UPI0027E416D1|nr:hypothetical protein [Glaciibacter superstes]